MTHTRAEAFAPGTSANLGVGFDILGLALSKPGDTVIAEPCDEPQAIICDIYGDEGRLPRDAKSNTACIAADTVLKTINASHGVKLTLHKGLPLASGLGSSAASAVAAAVAVNALFGEPLSRAELLPASLDGEAAVSGYHADNVAPCLFGGITLVTGIHADEIFSLPVPEDIHLALVTPNIEVKTADARKVLPERVSLKTMVQQTGAVARLIDALHRGDIPELAHCIERDSVVEPARAHLIPHLGEVRSIAHRSGALGMFISGAGPTLCAICDDATVTRRVAAAMQAVFDEAGIGAKSLTTQITTQGAAVRSVATA